MVLDPEQLHVLPLSSSSARPVFTAICLPLLHDSWPQTLSLPVLTANYLRHTTYDLRPCHLSFSVFTAITKHHCILNNDFTAALLFTCAHLAEETMLSVLLDHNLYNTWHLSPSTTVLFESVVGAHS